MKKNITIINTGGTISMEKNKGQGVEIKHDSKVVENLIIQFSNLANIKVENVLSKPSPHISLNDMFEIIMTIKKEIENDFCDGVVVTHGTDTLEETSFFAQLVIDTNKPIVFTGSMNNTDDTFFDGPSNLSAAIKTSISEESKFKGVLMAFNNEINIPDFTTKSDTSKLDTFRALEFGPIGSIKNEKVEFNKIYKSNQIKNNLEEFRLYNVPIVKCYTSMDCSIIKMCISSKVDGIVLEGFGKGNVPKNIVSAISEAIKLNIPVVLTSRCPMGLVSDEYSYPGGGKDLFSKGAILSDLVNSPKARLKLIVALNLKMNNAQLKKYFHN